MTDYIFNYDTEASGPFTEGENVTFSGGAVGELITLQDAGTTGRMYVSIISGSVPVNNETITGGTSAATAAVDGTPWLSGFPFKIRGDISIAANYDTRWTGPNLGATHSCKYDTEASGPFVLNEILTFGNGATAELIQLTDNGTDGELFFRMLSDITLRPSDNDTITGGTSSATANVDGVVHDRTYTPFHLHRFAQDLATDVSPVGDDNIYRVTSIYSSKDTPTEINLLGTANIDDALSYHMYGGSISQADGDVVYSGVDIQVTDPDGSSEPVLIQNNAILSATTTEFWKNSYNNDGVSKVRLMIKTRTGAADINGKRLRGRLLEYQDSYFTGDVVLGTGIKVLSLFSSADGNNDIAEGTAAGYTITYTEGFQNVDLNNGNGAQEYVLSIDFASQTSKETYNRTKYDQRRGTSETLFGINAQLFLGNDLDVPYDNEASGPFSENEILTFGNGATALLLGLDDDGTTGNLYCQLLTGDAPSNNDTITGGTSAATADVNGVSVTRVINNQFVGVYTGSNYNPLNRGIVIDPSDAISGDSFTALDGSTQAPPNNQNGEVNATEGVTIVCYPWDGVSTDANGDPEPDFDQMSASGAQSLGAGTFVVASIPDNTPQTATLRIFNGTDYDHVPYSSHDGSTTFTLTGTLPNNVADTDNAYVAYIDEVVGVSGQVSFTAVYSGTPHDVLILATRADGTYLKPTPQTAVFGATGFSVNATEIAD